MNKKAVLIVSFGTIDIDALKKSIESMENSFKAAFSEYAVRRAFTSPAVIEKLAKQSGIEIDEVGAALKKLAAEGYEEVYVQPLYIVADKMYDFIRQYVTELNHSRKVFKKIKIGRPLLSYLGTKNTPDDFMIALEAVRTTIPELGSEKAVVFMCNGTQQFEYSVLQLKLNEAGIKNAFVYTADGFPSFEAVLRQLKDAKAKEVILAPFVLVGSGHLMNYLAGESEDSIKSKLESEDYTVTVHRSGLGENPAIQAIFIQHLKDAFAGKTANHEREKREQLMVQIK